MAVEKTLSDWPGSESLDNRTGKGAKFKNSQCQSWPATSFFCQISEIILQFSDFLHSVKVEPRQWQLQARGFLLSYIVPINVSHPFISTLIAVFRRTSFIVRICRLCCDASFLGRGVSCDYFYLVLCSENGQLAVQHWRGLYNLKVNFSLKDW